MVFGGVVHERLQLNEDTLWAGRPYDPVNPDAKAALPEVLRRQQVLRQAMPRRGVDLSWHDADVSFLEGALARGGREVADVIERAWRSGAVFDAWTEEFSLGRWLDAFAEAGVDPERLAAGREPERLLPWSHISAGVSAAFLEVERERAYEAVTTEDCTFAECTGCGVCSGLGVENVIAGGSRG
jgi:hypothetical protein